MTTIVPDSPSKKVEDTVKAVAPIVTCNITKEIADVITRNSCENLEYYEFLNSIDPIKLSNTGRAKILVLSPEMIVSINPPPDESEKLRQDKKIAVAICVIFLCIIIGLCSYIYRKCKKK